MPRQRDQRRRTPSERCTAPGDAHPQHTPPKQESDAVRITPAHTHRPTETTRGTKGTPTRGERATPTEEAAGNTAARRTTMPSPQDNDPGRHKGHHTGTRRVTATAPRAGDPDPQMTRDRGTGAQGGQPHGHLPDPPAQAARPGPHSKGPASQPHLTAPPGHQPAPL